MKKFLLQVIVFGFGFVFFLILFNTCRTPEHENEPVEVTMEYPEMGGDFETKDVLLLVSKGYWMYSDLEKAELRGVASIRGKEVLKDGVHYKYLDYRGRELPDNLTVWQSKQIK